jgi:hypothetical protein
MQHNPKQPALTLTLVGARHRTHLQVKHGKV